MRDDFKVYIRHCEERTVPVLEWFFRDFDVELMNGLNRRFADVLEDMFLKISDQPQRFALVLDGDLVPVIPVDEIMQLFIEPLHKRKRLITLNGNMIGKFFTMNRAMVGGIKSYNKSRIDLYLNKLDKTQQRPESHLYSKAGYFAHLRTNKPQVGHEYGQFLWHIHEKALQRGAKATKTVKMREGDSPDFIVFKEAYYNGQNLKDGHTPGLYRKDNLPPEYRREEKDGISPDHIEEEYLSLKEEIERDIRHDIGDVVNEPLMISDIEAVNSPILTKIKRKLIPAGNSHERQ